MSMKSTTVRFLFQLWHRAAPGAVERRAARLFQTPRRPRRARAPQAPNGLAATVATVRSGGEEVKVYAWGAGPAVLLVHGWEGRATQLTGFVEPLVRLGFRAVAVDLPAHGLSTGARTNLVLSARALGDVARVAGPFQAVIAHSFGSAAVMLAHLEHPLAERLVALAPSAEPRMFVNRALDHLGVEAERRQGIYREIEASVGRTFEDVDLGRLQAATATAALALHDPGDEEVPFAHAEAWAGVSRCGQVIPVKDVGHRRILKDPSAIALAIEFATGIPRALDLPAEVHRGERAPGLRWVNPSGAA